MSVACTTANMQDNAAAFEAWALYARVAGYKHVVLSESDFTEELRGIKNLHYNRFLYRVACFDKGFDWFAVSDRLNKKIETFENTELKRDLFVNVPVSLPKEPNLKSREAVMEKRLAHEINREYLNSVLETNINMFYRQLPVGLFGERVITGKAIFPSDKAAIDIWGLEGDKFHLIELKVGKNRDLGVLSEVFFYACFINDMYCSRHLERKDPVDLQKYKFDGDYTRGYSQLSKANVSSVAVYILTERKHPRLDDTFAELQKCKLSGIEFASVKCRPLFEEAASS
jgi:hypothetical protein